MKIATTFELFQIKAQFKYQSTYLIINIKPCINICWDTDPFLEPVYMHR